MWVAISLPNHDYWLSCASSENTRRMKRNVAIQAHSSECSAVMRQLWAVCIHEVSHGWSDEYHCKKSMSIISIQSSDVLVRFVWYFVRELHLSSRWGGCKIFHEHVLMMRLKRVTKDIHVAVWSSFEWSLERALLNRNRCERTADTISLPHM